MCVAIPCTPDVRFVDVPAEVTHEEGHTGFLHFQQTLFVPIVNVGRRGAYQLVHGDAKAALVTVIILRFIGPLPADSRR